MTTAAAHAPLPRRIRRERRTVHRADVMTAMEHYMNTPGVRAVELILFAGAVVRVVVHRESGDREELTVTEDVR